MPPPAPKKPKPSSTHGDGYFFFNRSTQWAQIKGFDECVVCGISFAYKEIFNRHISTYHHKGKPRKSEIQNKKSKSTKPPASNLVVTLMIDELIKAIFDKVAESGM